MATLNDKSSLLLQKYKAHGATDVTGFGILGHAKNLAAAQIADVDLVIEALPIILGMENHYKDKHDFKVTGGFSAETSGGILTMVDPSMADDFIAEANQVYG
jgi:selenide, water dikinase